METKIELGTKSACESLPEWEKPSVQELDINSITLNAHGAPGTFDGATYS